MPRLEKILGAKSRVEVLRALIATQEPMTGREIARETRASLKAVQLALKALEEEGVVLSTTLYGARPYRINMDDPLVRQGLVPLFALDRPVSEDVVGALKAAVDAPYIREAVLSITLSQGDSKGPLTLYYIPRSGASDTARIESALKASSRHVASELGREIEFVSIRYAELRERMSDPDFRRAVLEKGETLIGSPLQTFATV